MSDSSRRKRPLVAEKRYASKKKKSQVKPRRRKAQRRVPKRSFLSRVVRWVTRLVWSVIWRISLAVAVVVGLAVGYFWTTLPDANSLLDARARGSVTLLDRNGAVFAWRGDQFGGVVTAQTVSPHLKNAVVATEDKRDRKSVV